ncbi:hypothetical protein E4T56_gene13722 [Termitomyces sp. T112]|nr:hypothetical protein E4T56_gene13722 [Termitomyces sp. T112]
MDSTLISDKTSSSPMATLNTSKKGMSSMVLALNTHHTILDHHNVDIVEHDSRIKQIVEEDKVLCEELDQLKKKVSVQDKTIQNLGARIEGFDKVYSIMREREEAQENSDSCDEDFDKANIKNSVAERERAVIEASKAAYRDNSVKELAHLSYMFLMGIGKLVAESLP